MQFTAQKLSMTLRTILVAWLLLAQATAFAHEASHEPAGEPETCITCSVGNAFQHGAVDSTPWTFHHQQHSAELKGTSLPLVSVPASPAKARAPPHYS